jgi:hypothetical protein
MPQIFIVLKTSVALAGFEHANLGSNGKHANHDTTEVTFLYIVAQKLYNPVQSVKTTTDTFVTVMLTVHS